jgi:hypothetical protein
MRRLLLSGALLLPGCQGTVGPFQRRCNPPPPDNPCMPIDEQKRLERDRLALPDPSPAVGPRTDTWPPWSPGR